MPAPQLSLFGSGAVEVSLAAGTPPEPRRIWLDDESWLDHTPGFLAGHLTLLKTLRDTVPWTEQRREMFDQVVMVPRLMGRCPPDAPPVLREIGATLDARYGVHFDSLLFALYRDGRDSVACHGDRGAREVSRAHVVTLSLGAPRRFSVRPRDGHKNARRTFSLGWGDLMVMGGACQRAWDHAVPKIQGPAATRIGPRLVVMYRSSEEWDGVDVTFPEKSIRSVGAHEVERMVQSGR